jgi:hypothetical protein
MATSLPRGRTGINKTLKVPSSAERTSRNCQVHNTNYLPFGVALAGRG